VQLEKAAYARPRAIRGIECTERIAFYPSCWAPPQENVTVRKLLAGGPSTTPGRLPARRRAAGLSFVAVDALRRGPLPRARCHARDIGEGAGRRGHRAFPHARRLSLAAGARTAGKRVSPCLNLSWPGTAWHGLSRPVLGRRLEKVQSRPVAPITACWPLPAGRWRLGRVAYLTATKGPAGAGGATKELLLLNTRRIR
jgi:hypothetical protein